MLGYQQLVKHEKESEEKDGQKLLSTYDFDKRKVSRGFSLSNFQIIQDEREKQKSVVSKDCATKEDLKDFGTSSHQSFVLPDISMLDKDVAYIIKTELISRSALQILTNAGYPCFCFRLNFVLLLRPIPAHRRKIALQLCR